MGSWTSGRGRKWSLGLATSVSAALAATLFITTPVEAAPDEGTTVPADVDSPSDVSPSGGDQELTAQDGFSARLTAISSGKRVEDLSLRTQNEQVFANPDGTWTSESTTMAQFVERDGVLEPIDDSGVLTDAETPVIGDGTQLRVADGNERVGDGPTDSSVALAHLTTTDSGSKDVLEVGWEGDLTAPAIADNHAVYSGGLTVPVDDDVPAVSTPSGAAGTLTPSTRGAFSLQGSGSGVSSTGVFSARSSTTGSPGASSSVPARLEVEPLQAGFAHRTIIDTVPDGDVVVRFPLSLSPGLTVVKEEETGDLRVLNTHGQTVFFAPAPTMWDEAVDPRSGLHSAERGVETQILMEDGQPVVVLRADGAWLRDPRRVYPVTIDPTWTTNVSDTWAESDVTGSKAGDVELRVGTFNGGGVKARSFLQFASTTLNGKKITKAELRMRNYYSYSCTSSPVKVQRLTSTWVSSDVRWSAQPTATATGEATNNVSRGYSSSCAEAYVYYPVTAIAQYWADNPTKNFGVRLIGADETNSYTWKRYRSANYATTPDYRPKFIVTYNTYPGTPTNFSVASGQSFKDSAGTTWVKTKTPTLSAKVTDGDGGTVKAEFDVTGTPTFTKAAGTPVASGGVSTYKPTLTDGNTYTVQAWANDGTLRSKAATAALKFTVDATPPPVPTISASAYASSGTWLDVKPASNTFTFTSTASDVLSFEYSLDGAAVKSVSATVASGKATGSLALNPAGGHQLIVSALDKAGNKSGTKAFIFGNGNAMIQTPTSAGVKTTSTYQVKATAPGQGLTEYLLMWRLRGDTDAADYNPATGSSNNWQTLSKTTATSSESAVTAQALFNTSEALTWLKDHAGVDRTRKHTVFEVQMCFVYSGGSNKCTWVTDATSHATITYVPHAFGDNFPTADAGPGQVALLTGEFNTSATDVSVPGYLGDLSISRSYSTFNNQHNGPFGKGWKPSFDGSDAGAAGYEVVDDTAFDGTIALVDDEENAVIFSQGKSKTAQKLGVYAAVDDDTAQLGMKLELKMSGTNKVLVLTEDDGTVTTWLHKGSGNWEASSVMVAGDPSATRFTYNAGGDLIRIEAPHPTSISCTAGSEQPGCRILILGYTTLAGAPRVTSVDYRAFDPATSTMQTIRVAEYAYDTSGNLSQAIDSRTGLSTQYEYQAGSIANVTRLTKITPSGLAGYTLAYKAGSATAPFTDGVLSVMRGTTYTNAFGYDLGVTNPNLPAMTSAKVAAWGQRLAPTNVFAVFSQDSATQAVSAITADTLKKADLWYTDGDGRVINTLAYTGAQGGSWLYTATDYDESGNTIRTLDATAISLILADIANGQDVDPNEYATITRYNADITAPATVSVGGTTITAGTVVTPAGTMVTDTWEPVREIVDSDGTVSMGRQHTHITYDQGAPNSGYNPDTGLPFRLSTTSTLTLAEPGSASSDPSVALPAGEPLLSEQRLGYNPIDGASVTGKTSGWMVGSATTSTTENGATDITTKTVYDEQGRVIKEIGADSTGSDAGTTVTYYYDAGAPAGLPTACANKPQWVGLTCQTRTGEATPTVRVHSTTKYSRFLAPEITTEVLGAVTRQNTTVFDGAGRVDSTYTSVTGLAGSTSQPTVKNVYDTLTGLHTETHTLNSDGSLKACVKTGYDSWGRAISYTDEGGKVSTTTYDSAGRVSKDTSSTGVVTTYTYEPYSGAVTKKNVSGVGDFTATYDISGNIVSQALPTGVVQSSTYDRVGQETSMLYTVSGEYGEAGYGWTISHDALGRISAMTGPTPSGGSRISEYQFDLAARMTSVHDRIDEQCTTRAYGFDVVGRRTSLNTSTSTCDDGASVVNTSKVWTYDKADRILKGANASGTYVYDALGRQTSLPAIDTAQGSAGGNLSVAYYDSDLARSVTQNGVTTTYTLDVMDRRSTSTTTSGAGTSTTIRYYEDTSDNPAWATTTTAGVTEKSRYLSAIAGDLAVTMNVDTKFLSTGILDPQGSVVATSYSYTPPLDEGATPSGPVTMWSELGVYDEYGNTITESETQHTGALPYGWLGGKERATDVSGLVLMGVRLYNSVTGQFTSVDPLVGGNSTAYAYPQDPINQYDLDGRLNWKRISGVLKKVAKVTAAAGFAACVLASAGICGAATAIGLGVSAGLNYSRWRAKEISGGTALGTFAFDVFLSKIPGGRSTQLTGRHAATSLSIPGRRAIGSTARAVSHQGRHMASSLRGNLTSSARTFTRNIVGEWKTHPGRLASRSFLQAGLYYRSTR